MAVIVRLHQLKLLPEETRKAVVRRIKDLAVDIPDSSFMKDGIRDLFTEDEFIEIIEHVKQELLAHLGDVVSTWSSSFDRDYGDPEDYFDQLKHALQDYRVECMGDEGLSEAIEEAIDDIREATNSLRDRYSDTRDDSEGYYGGSSSSVPASDVRSVFEDVDH